MSILDIGGEEYPCRLWYWENRCSLQGVLPKITLLIGYNSWMERKAPTFKSHLWEFDSAIAAKKSYLFYGIIDSLFLSWSLIMHSSWHKGQFRIIIWLLFTFINHYLDRTLDNCVPKEWLNPMSALPILTMYYIMY